MVNARFRARFAPTYGLAMYETVHLRRESVFGATRSNSVSVRGIYLADSPSSWIQACKDVESSRYAEHALGNAGPEVGPTMFEAIAAFFRGLFVRKDDNYKALLIADLGIER